MYQTLNGSAHPLAAKEAAILAVPEDERVWVPQADGVWFRPLMLNTLQGQWCNLLRVRKAGVLSRHLHPAPVHGYVIKPAGYVEGKKYPVAFLIHGGPQGSFGDGWSFRWNPQTYAGAGYAVVMIDFHGSTGYGQAFTDAISQHWGDRPLEDLQKGWAYALKTYSFLDGDRAAALGASYGGYMIDWIAGNWKEPWKCLVTHDGVFDTRAMGYSTEELWFDNWENGGDVFTDPAKYDTFNPALHAKDWSVPMLVIHSDKDYRIPVEQGIGAFTALQRQGTESEFLRFPDENHWVLKPANSLKWHDTVFNWLDTHIGAQSESK